MTRYLTLLHTRPQFRQLWLAQLISLAGDWFNAIALVIIINRYADSNLAVGGLFLARALPPFLAGPFAGVVADRFPRRLVLITTDLLRALIVLGFLFVTSADRVWLIYVLSVAQFVVSAFFEPARSALLPSLVEQDELLTANTLASTTWSVMAALGSALGGVTAAVFGPRIALVIDALSFVASALLVWRIVVPAPVVAAHAPASGWSDFVAGLNYIRERADVGALTLVKALGQVGSVDVVVAAYARNVFVVGQDGATTLGLMFAFFGLGAILGPLVGNLFHDNSPRQLQRAILAGYGVIALSWWLIGAAPALEWALAGCVLRGMGGSLNWTYSDVLLQTKVPNQFLGRVFAFDFGTFTLAYAISIWLTSVALDSALLDVRALVLWLAALSVGPVIVWFAATRFIEHDEVIVAGSDSHQYPES
ncbi:MAG: MFS transporter [Anaerolineales bacterium]